MSWVGAWEMLGVVTIFSMAAFFLLIITFTTVIVLVADLDRPRAGLLQVSQQPLIDLLTRMGTPAP